MQIIDLSPEYHRTFFICLEEWSDEMKDSGQQRENWFNEMLNKGLRVKLALTEENVIAGFIQYLPVEHSILCGHEGYFIYCIWVHGHKQGRGNLQKKGIGKALLQTAEYDAKMLGAKGMAAWGLILPFWMQASWFKKHGYKQAARDGMAALMWKPFTEDAIAPNWRKAKKLPTPIAGKLLISIFNHGWCATQNIAAERMKQVAKEFPEQAILQEYNTRDRAVIEEWGLSDAIYLDDKLVNTGPPPSYKKLKALVMKKLKRI